MLSKVNYFAHFDAHTRQKLISISKHSIYRQGAKIIHSDDLDDKIIVVISGAVSVFIKDKLRPDDFERVRHTLYPGDSIGDAPLRLILTSDNLHLYLRAAIDSDVLLIKKNDIPEILKNEICTLLEHKIMPLQKCPLFASEDH
jgi:CRP-like cAMP-binding protein